MLQSFNLMEDYGFVRKIH
uniref:Uncharacterized protein n=1 Tax=Arundo donax TaxID=35708 RepID=A0A0A8Z3A4_ARUDO